MNVAQKIGKKTVRLTHELVNIALLIFILLLLVFACYAIWDTAQVHHEADASRYDLYKPTEENEGASFQELSDINPEVFAWLTLYGTHIDYPVAQSDNNQKYINTDAWGEYSLSGAIFLDYKNSPDFSDFNHILYGHHMEKSTMFGEIGSFTEKSYFDDHRYGSLYYGGKEHGLEFFAFMHTDAYNSFVFSANILLEDMQQDYLDNIYEIAMHIREDVPVSISDRIVLLSTCSESTTNGRDLLVGKITDEVYADPFYEEPAEWKQGSIIPIDKLTHWFEDIQIEFKVLLILIPFLLIILEILIVRAFRKKKRVSKWRRR